MSVVLVVLSALLASLPVRAITQQERSRQEAKQDLLGMHCIERSACMRLGGNMIG